MRRSRANGESWRVDSRTGVVAKLFLLLAVGAAATACIQAPPVATDRRVAADATEGAFSLSPFEWDGQVSAGDKVDIANPFGDLRIRAAVEGHVVVSAQIQRFSGDDRDIRVVVDEIDGETRIRVSEFPLPAAQAARGSERGSNGQFDGRVDMALLLPHATSLRAETTSGLLQIKGYDGAATLVTGSGRILASTSTAVVARADSGEVRVGFRGTSWTRTSELTTRSGSITVNVPDKANLSIEAKTRGTLTSSLNRPAGRPTETMKTTLGNGSARLIVQSNNGAITLTQDGVH